MVVEIFEDKEKVKIYANDNNVTLYVDDLALLLEDDFAKQLINKVLLKDSIIENLGLSSKICDIIRRYIFNNLDRQDLIKFLEAKNIILYSLIVHVVSFYQRLYRAINNNFSAMIINCNYDSFDCAVKVIEKYGVPTIIRNRKMSLHDYQSILSNYCLEKLDCLGIKIDYQGNTRAICPSKLFRVASFICSKVKQIKSYNLSPLEQIIYVYDIVKSRRYMRSDSQDGSSSRSLDMVLFEQEIVCAGYVNIFNAMLKALGHDAHQFINSQNSHVRSIVYIKDPKYLIEGVYVFDPTGDSRKENDSYINWYRYFAMSMEESNLTFSNSLSQFLSYDFHTVRNRLNDNDSLEDEEQILNLLRKIFVIAQNEDEYNRFEKKIRDVFLSEEEKSEIEGIYQRILTKYSNATIDSKTLFIALYFVRRIQYYTGTVSDLSIHDIEDCIIAREIAKLRKKLLARKANQLCIMYELFLCEEKWLRIVVSLKKEIAKLLPDKSLARDRENMKLLRRLNTCVSKKSK